MGKIRNKHEKLRKILIESGSKEHGDLILDEICNLFNYPTTEIYYKEVENYIYKYTSEKH